MLPAGSDSQREPEPAYPVAHDDADGLRVGVYEGDVCATAEARAGLGEVPQPLGGPMAHPMRTPMATGAAAPAATTSGRKLTERTGTSATSRSRSRPQLGRAAAAPGSQVPQSGQRDCEGSSSMVTERMVALERWQVSAHGISCCAVDGRSIDAAQGERLASPAACATTQSSHRKSGARAHRPPPKRPYLCCDPQAVTR